MSEFSKERIDYLRRKKRRKMLILLSQIFILFGFIVIWEICASFGIIDSFMMSSPSRILRTLINEKSLPGHIGVTVFETIIGFILGTVLGSAIAIVLWWSDFLSKVSQPFLVVLSSLPKVALGPIIIIWVGAGMEAIIVMALAISLIVTVMEMLGGFINTDTEKIKMIEAFGANRIQIFTKIVLPSNKHTFFNALKVNIGLSLVGVISGEFLVSKAGLGYLIVYGGQVFKMDLVMSSVIILAIVAAAMYKGVVLLEKYIK